MIPVQRPALSAPGRLFYDRDTLLAVTWGLAEATVFFIVPDVLLTRIAMLRGWRGALRACGWALVGAIGGGTLLYYAAANGHSAALQRMFDWMPGITPALMDRARYGLEDHGVGILFAGAWQGVPFKLYATQAGAMHIGWWMFLLTALVARCVRFVATSLIAWALATTVFRWVSRAKLQFLHVGFWTLFYVVYFSCFSR
jgi:membrane protein YqaA with SNARE-associated domain